MKISEKGEIFLEYWELSKSTCAIRFLVLWRDKFRCIYCDCILTTENQTVDHVVPESDMGMFEAENLVGCCKACNEEKHVTVLNIDEYKLLIKKTQLNSLELEKLTGVKIPAVVERISLHDRVASAYQINCQKCGSLLRLKYSAGNKDFFWGCSNYPKCRENKPVTQPELFVRLRTYYPNFFE